MCLHVEHVMRSHTWHEYRVPETSEIGFLQSSHDNDPKYGSSAILNSSAGLVAQRHDRFTVKKAAPREVSGIASLVAIS